MSTSNHITPDDLRQRLMSIMSDRQLRMTTKMAELNRKFVPFDRDDLLRGGIEWIFENPLEVPENGFLNGRLLLVTGATGAGKSRSVGQALKLKKQLLGEGAASLFIEAVAPSPCTPKQLAYALLHAMGYPLEKDLAENAAWKLVRDQLAIRGPMLIWIDEMQHVVDGLQSNDDIKKMLNTIKSIVQLQVWPPISLVMSGLPMLSDFTKMDSQINRRTREVAFDIIRLPDDLDDVQDVIQCTIADDVGLGVAPELTTGEFAARLCHATSKALGLVISLTRAAAVQAYGGERDVVCINDYG